MKKEWKPLVIILGVSVVFFFFFVAISISFFNMSGNVSEKNKTLFKKEYIGLIEVNGVIMDGSRFIKRIRELDDHKKVKAIVVQVNSPGGAVAPSQEMYEAIKKVTKPVYVSMSSVAASGGFYLAMGAKKIFANPGSITGSIGVIMEFANLEKLYEWAKVKRYSIKTGKFTLF